MYNNNNNNNNNKVKLPEVWGISLMYKLYRVGDRTEPCDIRACMYLGVDISPSTETLKFLCERNELISLIKF
jgi:hypothetical protein